jgi:hypothetical protein
MRPAQIARNGTEIIAIQYRRSSQTSISFIDTVAAPAKIAETDLHVLRAGRERPRRHAAEEREELVPLRVLAFRDHTLPHRRRECRVLQHSKNWRPMSQMGQTRSFGDVGPMSGFREADTGSRFMSRRPSSHVWFSDSTQYPDRGQQISQVYAG